MLRLPDSKLARTLSIAWFAALTLDASADRLLETDPYGTNRGFDLPSEAWWGGWTRGAAETLYAEWDVFDDASHAGATDRSAGPDSGTFGTTAARLEWQLGTFISGTLNLYSFSVPERFTVHLAGPVATGPIRVALQVETGGLPLDSSAYRLNGTVPSQIFETFRNRNFDTFIGPTDLIHTLVVWRLDSAPEAYQIEFASPEPHMSLMQVAVDVGPADDGVEIPVPIKRTVPVTLTPESVATELQSSLSSQRPKLFPAEWPAGAVVFRQTANRTETRLQATLKASLKGLYYDPRSVDPETNLLLVDFLRPPAPGNPPGDTLIATCELKPFARKLTSVVIDGVKQRVGVANYQLDLAATRYPARATSNRLSRKRGLCKDPDGAVTLPDLVGGDYAVVRRSSPSTETN